MECCICWEKLATTVPDPVNTQMREIIRKRKIPKGMLRKGPVVLAKCGHLYHLNCLARYFQRTNNSYIMTKGTCPVPNCGGRVTEHKLVPVYLADDDGAAPAAAAAAADDDDTADTSSAEERDTATSKGFDFSAAGSSNTQFHGPNTANPPLRLAPGPEAPVAPCVKPECLELKKRNINLKEQADLLRQLIQEETARVQKEQERVTTMAAAYFEAVGGPMGPPPPKQAFPEPQQ